MIPAAAHRPCPTIRPSCGFHCDCRRRAAKHQPRGRDSGRRRHRDDRIARNGVLLHRWPSYRVDNGRFREITTWTRLGPWRCRAMALGIRKRWPWWTVRYRWRHRKSYHQDDFYILRKTPCNGQIAIEVDLTKAINDPRQRPIIQPGDSLILQYKPCEEVINFGIGAFFTYGIRYLFNNNN